MTAINRDLAAQIAKTGVPLTADMAPRRDACKGCGSLPEDWCPDCAACEDGCFGGHKNNPCSHSNASWGGRR
jgi:hypothetical protein